MSCTNTAKYREFRRAQSVQDIPPDIFRQKGQKVIVALLPLRVAGVDNRSLSCSVSSQGTTILERASNL